MSGKLLGLIIMGCALFAGAALYYLQVYYYYDEVDTKAMDISLTAIAGGEVEPIPTSGLQAIDADSSPIRFRACFTTPLSQALLSETFQPYPDAEPLNAPGWFECFDASRIGAALEDGTALAFLGQADIGEGVDRVVAVFGDGSGYVWHQLNAEFAD